VRHECPEGRAWIIVEQVYLSKGDYHNYVFCAADHHLFDKENWIENSDSVKGD
jgi:hypothetical protein